MSQLFRPATIVSFILVFSRISGFFVASPIIGARTLPAMFKALIVLVLTLLLFPPLDKISAIPATMGDFIILVAGQAVIGLLLGMAVSIVFEAIQSGGSLIDLQIGFSMSSLVDPHSGVMSTVNARWFYMIATMIFLGLDGHHWLVLGLINSFRALPLDSFRVGPGYVTLMIRSFSDIIRVAFVTAAPVLIGVILVDVTAGFIARTAPKLNILLISFPFKIFLGLFILMATFGNIMMGFSRYFSQLQQQIIRAFYI